jgi:hypothetical protein
MARRAARASDRKKIVRQARQSVSQGVGIFQFAAERAGARSGYGVFSTLSLVAPKNNL